MKRLLKISFDLALFSFIPILSWFILSLIVDERLLNVFSLTYPVQFVAGILKSLFSTSANIHKEKDKKADAVMCGITLGSVIGFLIFGVLIIFVDDYIRFMNMDVSFYRVYAIYSIIQMYIQMVFTFFIQKLYYENKNTQANFYSLIYNVLNFVVLIGCASFISNSILVVGITLISLLIYTIYVGIRTLHKFHWNFEMKKLIRYDSVELFNNIAFFFIFLFGLSNAFDYGEQYSLAITFVALITDTQWDVFDAIGVAAQIDLSKGEFHYRKHLKNAYSLVFILFLSIFILFIVLYPFYSLDFWITLSFLSFEIVNFLLCPIYDIKTYYLQLEYSPVVITTNKIFACIFRFIISLAKTPYCTALGQICSCFYQFISIQFIFSRHYHIAKNGKIFKK